MRSITSSHSGMPLLSSPTTVSMVLSVRVLFDASFWLLLPGFSVPRFSKLQLRVASNSNEPIMTRFDLFFISRTSYVLTHTKTLILGFRKIRKFFDQFLLSETGKTDGQFNIVARSLASQNTASA